MERNGFILIYVRNSCWLAGVCVHVCATRCLLITQNKSAKTLFCQAFATKKIFHLSYVIQNISILIYISIPNTELGIKKNRLSVQKSKHENNNTPLNGTVFFSLLSNWFCFFFIHILLAANCKVSAQQHRHEILSFWSDENRVHRMHCTYKYFACSTHFKTIKWNCAPLYVSSWDALCSSVFKPVPLEIHRDSLFSWNL